MAAVTAHHTNSIGLQVACGSRHTLFLSEANCVWAAGDNRRGQLGLGKHLAGNQTLARRVQALVGPTCPIALCQVCTRSRVHALVIVHAM